MLSLLVPDAELIAIDPGASGWVPRATVILCYPFEHHRRRLQPARVDCCRRCEHPGPPTTPEPEHHRRRLQPARVDCCRRCEHPGPPTTPEPEHHRAARLGYPHPWPGPTIVGPQPRQTPAAILVAARLGYPHPWPGPTIVGPQPRQTPAAILVAARLLLGGRMFRPFRHLGAVRDRRTRHGLVPTGIVGRQNVSPIPSPRCRTGSADAPRVGSNWHCWAADPASFRLRRRWLGLSNREFLSGCDISGALGSGVLPVASAMAWAEQPRIPLRL